MNLFYDDVMVGRRQDGSPIYAKDLREELARLRADSAELARVREPVIGLEVFEPCMDEDGARMIKTDKHDGYLRFSDAIRVAWQMVENAEKAIPEGFALVPVEVKRDAERYQWLCKQAAEDSGSAFMDRAISQLSEWVTPKHEIDSTIDAAPKGDSHE